MIDTLDIPIVLSKYKTENGYYRQHTLSDFMLFYNTVKKYVKRPNFVELTYSHYETDKIVSYTTKKYTESELKQYRYPRFKDAKGKVYDTYMVLGHRRVSNSAKFKYGGDKRLSQHTNAYKSYPMFKRKINQFVLKPDVKVINESTSLDGGIVNRQRHYTKQFLADLTGLTKEPEFEYTDYSIFDSPNLVMDIEAFGQTKVESALLMRSSDFRVRAIGFNDPTSDKGSVIFNLMDMTLDEKMKLGNSVTSWISNDSYILIGHNLKFDLKALLSWLNRLVTIELLGIDINETLYPFLYSLRDRVIWDADLYICKLRDTQIMVYMLNTLGIKSLKYLNNKLFWSYLNYEQFKDDYCQLEGIDNTWKDVPNRFILPYLAIDCEVTGLLYNVYSIAIAKKGYSHFLDVKDLELRTFLEMELNGFPVDVEYNKKSIYYLQQGVDIFFKRFIKTKEVQSVFKQYKYDKGDMYLELTPDLISKTSFKHAVLFGRYGFNLKEHYEIWETNNERLTEIADTFSENKRLVSFIDTFQKYFKLVKAMNTYVKKPLDLAINHHVYPTVNLARVATGRISVNYGFQNMASSRVSEEIRAYIKRCKSVYGVVDNTEILIWADFAQAELKGAAIEANCKAMLQLYKENRDCHDETTMTVMGLTPKQYFALEKHYRKSQRTNIGKVTNFGNIFKISAKGLVFYAKATFGVEMSLKDAIKLQKNFFDKYHEIGTYHETAPARARTLGYAETRYGFRRYLPNLYSNDGYLRSRAERQAINTPIQGSVGQMTTICKYLIQREVKCQNLFLLSNNSVHDSVGFKTKVTELPKVIPLIKHICEQRIVNYSMDNYGYELDLCPPTIDIEIGMNYGGLHELKNPLDMDSVMEKVKEINFNNRDRVRQTVNY